MTNAPARAVRPIAAIAAVGVALLAPSCGRLFPQGAGAMVKHPERYNGQVVTVSGTVKERVDMQRLRCYILDDGSGTIGVVTTGPMPNVGAKVSATGKVDTAFKLGKKTIIAIVEPDRPPTPRPAQSQPRKMPG